MKLPGSRLHVVSAAGQDMDCSLLFLLLLLCFQQSESLLESTSGWPVCTTACRCAAAEVVFQSDSAACISTHQATECQKEPVNDMRVQQC
jgi:branched-subunit amino acid transport protein AzlD